MWGEDREEGLRQLGGEEDEWGGRGEDRDGGGRGGGERTGAGRGGRRLGAQILLLLKQLPAHGTQGHSVEEAGVPSITTVTWRGPCR